MDGSDSHHQQHACHHHGQLGADWFQVSRSSNCCRWSLLDKKEVSISVDYTNYENFVHFSSAYTRLENFTYKVGLIENYTNQITSIIGTEGTNIEYSSSKATLTGQITDIIKNLDGYEYFLYFNRRSAQSLPKTNTEPPYLLSTTWSTQALTWLISTD